MNIDSFSTKMYMYNTLFSDNFCGMSCRTIADIKFKKKDYSAGSFGICHGLCGATHALI